MLPLYAIAILGLSAARELVTEKLVDKRIAVPRNSSIVNKILFIPYLLRCASAKDYHLYPAYTYIA
jgi:hypothetical protein